MSLDPLVLKLASRSCKLSSKKLNLFVPTLHRVLLHEQAVHIAKSCDLLFAALTCHCLQTRDQTQTQGKDAGSLAEREARPGCRAAAIPASR